MPFKKGESGNPGGMWRDKPFRDALRMEAAAAENGQDCEAPRGSLRWNARQLLDQGDVQSIKELADRFDGKSVQSLEVGKPGDFDSMNDDELRSFITSRAAIIGGGVGRAGKANGQAGVRGKSNGVH